MPNNNPKITPCCPEFDPKLMDKKTLNWKNKLFIKSSVLCLFHIPLNMGSVISKMWQKVQEAGAETELVDFIILSSDVSSWRSEQFLAVRKEVPGLENVKISGTFLTKVFEGPYKEVKNWYGEMGNYVKSQGKIPKKIYFYYTTCPKCAKIYGKNYVVAFAEIE